MYPAVLMISSLETLACQNGLTVSPWLPNTGYVGFFDGANLPLLPTVSNQDPDTLALFRWGYLPHWVEKPADHFAEARTKQLVDIERALDTPAIQMGVQTKRCIILIDGFLEKDAHQNAQCITSGTGEPMKILGIWSDCADQDMPDGANHFRTMLMFSKVRTIKDPITGEYQKKRLPLAVSDEVAEDWMNNKKHSHSVYFMVKHLAEHFDDLPLKLVSLKQKGTNRFPDLVHSPLTLSQPLLRPFY